jgi:hypothetical protein
MLHAKIVGDTRDGDVAVAFKKSPIDIVRHVGNLRKFVVAGAKAAIHAFGKPAAAKPHPAVDPPDTVAKPAAAKPHPSVEPPVVAQPAVVAITTDDVGALEISTVNLVALFDDYTAELDDDSNVLVIGHDVTVVVDRQKGIQVTDLIGKFNEKISAGLSRKSKILLV